MSDPRPLLSREQSELLYTLSHANDGVDKALYDLAHMYIQGSHGLMRSWEKAVPLLKESVIRENADAMRLLAQAYYSSLGGLKQDRAEAVSLWQKSALKGNKDAMLDLGVCFFDSGKNDSAFANLCQIATPEYPLACYYLGCMYRDGLCPNGVDLVEASRLLAISAVSGDDDAKEALRDMWG